MQYNYDVNIIGIEFDFGLLSMFGSGVHCSTVLKYSALFHDSVLCKRYLFFQASGILKISLVEIHKRVGKSVIAVCGKT